MSGWQPIWEKARSETGLLGGRHGPPRQKSTSTIEFAYNGDGVRASKTVAGDTTQYVLDLAATLPVVISDSEAVPR